MFVELFLSVCLYYFSSQVIDEKTNIQTYIVNFFNKYLEIEYRLHTVHRYFHYLWVLFGKKMRTYYSNLFVLEEEEGDRLQTKWSILVKKSKF